MTIVASSAIPIDHRVLINAILELTEKDFWDIVGLRLNLPPSQEQQDQITVIGANEHIEYYTEARLIDDLFLRLASTKQTILHDDKSITVYKYYRQALALRKWIPIARPAPAFVVNTPDLSAREIAELKVLDDAQIILKQAVSRIFENIDASQYHLSIAQFLEVVLE